MATQDIFQEVRMDVQGLETVVHMSKHPPPSTKPDLLMVQGMMVSRHYLMPTAERLVSDFNIYIPDLPGQGKSAKISRALNITETADFLCELLDILDLKKPVIYANSQGCQFVIDLASRHPERVERLILSGPTVDALHRSYKEIMLRALITTMYEKFPYQLIMMKDHLRASYRQGRELLRHAMADRPEAKLHRIPAPTLIIRGEKDKIATQRWVDLMVNLLPNGEGTVLGGVPHALNYSAAPAIAAEIRRFALSTQPAEEGVRA
jgi:2-hydroxy-6-oxonona-2,4-dienedioate hydrolase